MIPVPAARTGRPIDKLRRGATSEVAADEAGSASAVRIGRSTLGVAGPGPVTSPAARLPSLVRRRGVIVVLADQHEAGHVGRSSRSLLSGRSSIPRWHPASAWSGTAARRPQFGQQPARSRVDGKAGSKRSRRVPGPATLDRRERRVRQAAASAVSASARVSIKISPARRSRATAASRNAT
jgi:hypothetical protein